MIDQRFQRKGYGEQALEVELGLKSSVTKAREDGRYLRELKIARTTPKEFDFELDA